MKQVSSFLRSYFLFILSCALFLSVEGNASDPAISQVEITGEKNEPTEGQDAITVTLTSENKEFQPGKALWVLVNFQIAPDWHLYWKNPGDAGVAPQIQWILPPAFYAGEPLWPSPERIEIGDSVIFGYSDGLKLLVPIFSSKVLMGGSTVDIKANISWVACSRICVPGKAFVELSLPVKTENVEINQDAAHAIEQARKHLPEAQTAVKSHVNQGELQVEIPIHNLKHAEIKNVYFFPEETGLFDPHENPKWEIAEDGKTLITQFKNQNVADKVIGKTIRGVLAVDIITPIGVKRRSWSVALKPEPPKVEEVQSQIKNEPTKLPTLTEQVHKTFSEMGSSHIEQLESQVWYRPILNKIDQILHTPFVSVLILAFLGGIILNVMPCVLPVISLKVLHFVQLANQDRKLSAKHGLFFALGILVSFWALAGGLFALQSTGKAFGWGFQLQEPMFVAVLILMLFVLTLSLFGVFEFGIGMASYAQDLDLQAKESQETTSQKHLLTASFFSGVLATFVASPCTGPLLGSALGFTATLHPAYAFAVFTALGLGMAFPYFVLSCFPVLLRILPRPGRWMVTFKQFMGFFMLATVFWLIWVLDAQVPNLPTVILLISLFALSIGLWIYGTWGTPDRSKVVRAIARILAFIAIVWGSYFFLKNVHEAKKIQPTTQEKEQKNLPPGKEWEPFSRERLQELQKQNIPVFVDFSAKWCLTCQTNAIIFELPEVKKAFVRYGVVKMLADWTSGDPEITDFLRSLGRNGVPVYAVYSKKGDEPPLLMPEIVTPDMVIEALRKAHE